MLSRVRRHLPEALLIPFGLGAIIVTLLSDVDEIFDLGEESGILVSEICFAYVGAYVFNRLIVERPKAQAIRGYYRAAWSDFMELALGPSDIVGTFTTFAAPHERIERGVGFTELKEILSSTPWQTLGQAPLNLVASIVDKQRLAYDRLVPLLNNFEPEVSVAMAALNASAALTYIQQIRDSPDMMSVEGVPAHLAVQLVDYQMHGRRLAEALERSRYIPKIQSYIHSRVQYSGLGESVAADSIDLSRLRPQ